jgi:hypothetical protein
MLRARHRYGDALALYAGPFLEGFHPRHCGAEVEEWVYQTREHLAGHARQALLAVAESHAERGRLADATARAETAYRLPGAAPADADELRQMHAVAALGAQPERAPRGGGSACARPRSGRPRRARAPPVAAPGPVAANQRIPQRVASFVGRTRERGEIGALLA